MICILCYVLQMSHLLLDDSFAQLWHSLIQIHEVVTWNGFHFTGVPCQELICGISCLLNVIETISCVVQR